MSNDSIKRAKKIIKSVPSIQRRMGNTPLVTAQGSGHASTTPDPGFGAKKVTLKEPWAPQQTDKRLQATLYHESIHVEQHSTGLMSGCPS